MIIRTGLCIVLAYDFFVSCMQAKQTAMEEMTQGQAATLVRNEQIIDQAAEEMDDLEEMLNESISDSMRSTKEKAAGQGKQQKKRCWPALQSFQLCILPGRHSIAEPFCSTNEWKTRQAEGREGPLSKK